MQGFQVTFFTEQGRRHGRQQIQEWLMALGKSLGIKGITTVVGVEGIGRDGKLHSAHFFELAEQPVEVTMIVTQPQAAALFEQLEQEHADLFYVKMPVEFGVVGQTGPA
jgi:PII-like signaling protein